MIFFIVIVIIGFPPVRFDLPYIVAHGPPLPHIAAPPAPLRTRALPSTRCPAFCGSALPPAVTGRWRCRCPTLRSAAFVSRAYLPGCGLLLCAPAWMRAVAVPALCLPFPCPVTFTCRSRHTCTTLYVCCCPRFYTLPAPFYHALLPAIPVLPYGLTCYLLPDHRRIAACGGHTVRLCLYLLQLVVPFRNIPFTCLRFHTTLPLPLWNARFVTHYYVLAVGFITRFCRPVRRAAPRRFKHLPFARSARYVARLAVLTAPYHRGFCHLATVYRYACLALP